MNLASLLDALSQPIAFPFPVDDVQVRQTHISAVFLAGDYAYKVKKPVRLSFVDFSTLERRRYYCEREVHLNRRLARDVYLEVVPITRADGRLQFEGSGEPIEWAVKMRRLSESDTLAARVQADEVDPSLLDDLGRKLAEFHRDSASDDEISMFARFDSVAANVADNLAAATTAVGTTISARVCARLTELTTGTLRELRTLIEQRAARGVARDTHGDLRLEHVYHQLRSTAADDDWLIVDCIEFNDALRFADPVADIAFLVMDLKAAGRRDLAGRLADSYFAALRDSEGRRLLPFYISYRASVRAKVEGIEIGESEVPRTGRLAATAKACGHWLLALGELEAAARRPCVVLVAGLPGVGKSTVAAAAARLAGFQIIRADEVRKELAGLPGLESARTEFRHGIYSTEWTDRTYAECLARMQRLLLEGHRVAVDATFAIERHRREFLEAAGHWGVPAICLHCECASETVRVRLAVRHGDASDADWDIHRAVAEHWEPFAPRTLRHVRSVNTAGSADETASQVLTALQREQLALEAPQGITN